MKILVHRFLRIKSTKLNLFENLQNIVDPPTTLKSGRFGDFKDKVREVW